MIRMFLEIDFDSKDAYSKFFDLMGKLASNIPGIFQWSQTFKEGITEILSNKDKIIKEKEREIDENETMQTL